MHVPALSASPPAIPGHLNTLVSRLLASCLDISALWSIGHPTLQEPNSLDHGDALLAFADPATLAALRRADALHTAEVQLFVVLDGDCFESAWGTQRLSGSLARWAWRQSSEFEAYYEEARWGDAGGVIRVRRKALRLWPAAGVPAP